MIKVSIRYKVTTGLAGDQGVYIAREYDDAHPIDVEDVTREYGQFDSIEEAVQSVADTFAGEEFILKLDI